jgi:hypothetical protein
MKDRILRCLITHEACSQKRASCQCYNCLLFEAMPHIECEEEMMCEEETLP